MVFIVFGTVSTFILEYNHTLAEHPIWWRKWVAAFFTGTSSRTAGLNVVDMDGLAFPTIMLTMLLMWIGGSPGSTAGGIKTTTFTVAFLNIISLARGKDKLKIFKRQISTVSVNNVTCGLSLGITPELSDASEVVITITMFISRVGLLTLLVAPIKDTRNRSLTYPTITASLKPRCQTNMWG